MTLSWRARATILGCRMALLGATMGLSLPCMKAILSRGGSAWWMALLAAAHLAGLALIGSVIRREISLSTSGHPVAPAVNNSPSQAAGRRRQQNRRQKRRAVSGAGAAVALSALAFDPLGQRAAALWAGRGVRWLGAQVHASNFAAAVMLLALCGLLSGLAAGLRQIRDIERLGAEGTGPGVLAPMAYTSGPEPP